MITIPPRNFCIIENPVARTSAGQIQLDDGGQAKLLHADQEIRLSRDPFPLYPGEVLKQVSAKRKRIPEAWLGGMGAHVPICTALQGRQKYPFPEAGRDTRKVIISFVNVG